MKKNIVFLIFVTLILFSGCFFENPLGITKNPYSGEDADLSPLDEAEKVLPPDSVDDSLRASSRSVFSFETLVSVRLVLDVNFYSDSFELLPDFQESVVVLVEDSRGNTVFSGISDENGKLDREIRIPGAPEDMTLSIHAAGFISRTVSVKNMASFEKIDRIMGMVKEGTLTRSIIGTVDSDGDGIPDVYDAYPSDPDSAFAYLVPAEGFLTVAYEDLFGRAGAGDADYNDFISHYSIEESSGESGITKVHVKASAAVKLAGYNHTFGIRINSFVPPVDLTVHYIDAEGFSATRSERITDYPNPGETSLEVVLFEHTGKALGKDADFTLEFVNDSLNNPQNPDTFSSPPYNPYLFVINTGHDVHLIDEEPLYGSINPDDSFRDIEGFPWGLLVPPGSGEDGWPHPAEGQRIEEPYPRFTRWRESGGELSPDWYLHSEPWVEEPAVTLYFSSDRDGDFEIYSMDIDAGTTTQLTFNTSVDKHPAVSADGSKLAFVSDRSGSWGIYTMNSDGAEVSGLLATLGGSFFGHPSWSPDGSKIVYDNNYDIFTMNADGSGVFNMTNTPFTNELYPSWSPDGGWIAYSSRADGDYDLYTRPAEGSGVPAKLTNNTAVDEKPDWSPDGAKIVFASNTDSNYDIYSMNRDGSGLVNLTSTPSLNEKTPSWSAGGIAFAENGDIYVMQYELPDSVVNITANSSLDQEPTW